MSATRIISINPGDQTRGAFTAEGKRVADAGRRLLAGIARSHSKSGFIDFITGISRGANRAMSVKLLAVRLLCGTIFITLGITGIGADASPVAAVQLAVGISMVTGFATRIFCIASAIFFGLTAYAMFGASLASETILAAALAAGSLIVALTGPGLFSLDQVTRFLASASVRKAASRRKEMRRPLTYRAYWN